MKKYNSKKKSSISGVASPYALSSGAAYMVLLILSVFLLLSSIFNPSQLSSLRSTTTDFITPVISFVGKPFQLAAYNISSISGFASIRAENTSLKSENARLKEWYQTALMLQAENQSLQKLLNVKTQTHQNFITTRIVSDMASNFIKTIIVSSGANDGVKKNQAVLSGEGMIGRVIEAGENSARVLLLTDINSRLPVLIEGTNQKAILTGTNNDIPLLKHLPKDTGMVEGARIVTSGDGGIFPSSLPIGRVVKTNGDYGVKLYGEIDKISFVRVVDTTSPINLIRGDFSQN